MGDQYARFFTLRDDRWPLCSGYVRKIILRAWFMCETRIYEPSLK